MSLHISKQDAKDEAIRLARAFLDAECQPQFRSWYREGQAMPARDDPKPRHRKVPLRYLVIFPAVPNDGVGIVGGEAMVWVDIETRQARWDY